MTALPLIFVVSVSMAKDLFEDNERRKQDNAENNLQVLAARRGS